MINPFKIPTHTFDKRCPPVISAGYSGIDPIVKVRVFIVIMLPHSHLCRPIYTHRFRGRSTRHRNTTGMGRALSMKAMIIVNSSSFTISFPFILSSCALLNQYPVFASVPILSEFGPLLCCAQEARLLVTREFGNFLRGWTIGFGILGMFFPVIVETFPTQQSCTPSIHYKTYYSDE